MAKKNNIKKKVNFKNLKDTVDIQYCPLFEIRPSKITCIDIDQSHQRLAFSRENGTVEFWDISSSPFTMINCRTFCQNKGIRRIKFFENTSGFFLYVFGLDSIITELNMLNNNIKTSTSYGGSIWDAAIFSDGKLLACACEDGTLRIFKIKNELTYKSKLVVSEKKLLSLCWTSDMKIITGGIDGQISVWSLENKKNLMRFTTEKSLKNSILTLKVFGNTVISGDSNGNTNFWDITMGTLISSFTAHNGSVQTIGEDKNSVYTTGEDSKVVRFFQRPTGDWSIGKSFHIHTHEVASLTIDKEKKLIFSGGANGNIAIVSCNPLRLTNKRKIQIIAKDAKNNSKDISTQSAIETLSHFPYTSKFKVSISKSSTCLIGYDKLLTLWDISKRTSLDNSARPVPPPFKLLNIETVDLIASCDMSPNGCLLVVATHKDLTVMSLEHAKDRKIDQISHLKIGETSKEQIVKFISNSMIVVISCVAKIHFYKVAVKEGLINLEKTLEWSDKNLKKCFTISCVTVFDNLFAVSYASGQTLVFDQTKKLETASLAKTVVCSAFSCDKKYLFFVALGCSVGGYDIENNRMIDWFKKYKRRTKQIIKSKTSQSFLGIEADPVNPNIFYAYNEQIILTIDISKPPPPPASISKIETHTTSSASADLDLFSEADEGSFDISNFQSVYGDETIFLRWYKSELGEDSKDEDYHIVLVKPNSKKLTEALPKPVYRHKYGTGT